MIYEALVVEPIKDMTGQVISFIPTLFISLGILIIGWIATRLVTKLFVKLLRTVEFDHISDKIGLTKILRTGGISEKPSTMVGCVAYWVFMVMVLIMTVKAFGVPLADDFLHKFFTYIPSVVIGSLVLIVGMLLAKVVSTLIYVTAKNTDMPAPETLQHLTKLAIMAYVTIMFLKEVGFVSLFDGVNYTIFITGVVFALALAFGLAGKDVASKYLDVLKK